MTLYCASCRKHYPLDDFRVQRRDGYRLWTGHRVKFAQHRACRTETIMLDVGALPIQRRVKQPIH